MQLIDYEIGDVLEVLPGQSSAAVDAFIQRCNLNPESYITVGCSLNSFLVVVYSYFNLNMHDAINSILIRKLQMIPY